MAKVGKICYEYQIILSLCIVILRWRIIELNSRRQERNYQWIIAFSSNQSSTPRTSTHPVIGSSIPRDNRPNR